MKAFMGSGNEMFRLVPVPVAGSGNPCAVPRAAPGSAWQELQAADKGGAVLCWTIALVLGLWLCGPADAAAREPKPVPPNVVVVVSDDQRWDMLGAAGNKTIVTPSMDRLARDGVYFREATTLVPQCAPSRMTLLTGLTIQQHGRASNSARDVTAPAANLLPMLPRALRAAGYRTVLTGKWHVDFSPVAAGFDDVRTWMAPGVGPYLKSPVLVRGADATPLPPAGYTNEIFGDEAVAFLESNEAAAQPFFLWVALSAPHPPMGPNPPDVVRLYAGKDERALWPPGLPPDAHPEHLRDYCEAVSVADRELGRILDALDRRKLAERTLVIFLSDNGFMLGSRDVGPPSRHLFQGKRYPYEASVRVPVIVRGPHVGRGVVDDHAVSTLDLPPTILAAAGVAPEKRWNGRDLGPLLRGSSKTGPEDALIELADVHRPELGKVEYRAVRTPAHKLIVWREAQGAELYDLVADPEERRNLFDEPGAAATRRDLARRLRRWLEVTSDSARQWRSMAAILP